jgi:hypothetical protein
VRHWAHHDNAISSHDWRAAPLDIAGQTLARSGPSDSETPRAAVPARLNEGLQPPPL